MSTSSMEDAGLGATVARSVAAWALVVEEDALEKVAVAPNRRAVKAPPPLITVAIALLATFTV